MKPHAHTLLVALAAIGWLTLSLFGGSANAASRIRNLAAGRPVVAESVGSLSHPARAAVDGRLSTSWIGGRRHREWIYVDLGVRYRIQRVLVKQGRGHRGPFTLQVSDNAVRWKTIYRSGRSGRQAAHLRRVARYVRVLRTGSAGALSVSELEVYGRPIHIVGRYAAKRSLVVPAPASAQGSVAKYGCAWGSFGDAGGSGGLSLPGECWRPFADSSWLGSALPVRPRLAVGGVNGENGDSAALVSSLMSHGSGAVRDLMPVVGTSWQHAMYFGASSDPVWTLSCEHSTRNCNQVNSAVGEQVHIPCGATVPNGTDMQLFVIDQSSGYEYDLGGLTPGQVLCGGGTFYVSLATKIPISGDGRGSCAADAACVGMSAGQIRESELAAGQIDHAIFVVNGVCDNTGTPMSLYPADPNNSCGGRNVGAPKVGQWYSLALSDAQIAATGFPSWQQTILRALAHYGMFVGDQGSSGAFDMFTEDQRTWSSFHQANPWVSYAQQLAKDPANHIKSATDTSVDLGLDNIPHSFWTQNLQAVDPCVIQHTC